MFFFLCFFFFNDTATTEIYTLSLHDALPSPPRTPWPQPPPRRSGPARSGGPARPAAAAGGDRKSTRLNSSHLVISYAVFCLKKKTQSARVSRQTMIKQRRIS